MVDYRRRCKNNRHWVGISDEEFCDRFMKAFEQNMTTQMFLASLHRDHYPMSLRSLASRTSKLRRQLREAGIELPYLRSNVSKYLNGISK